MESIQFGPVRAIGLRTVGQGGDGAFASLWSDKFVPRIGEVQKPADSRSFGFCRMIPDASNNLIEYTAAVEATQDAAIPDGMVEILVPAGTYLVKRVESLASIGHAWMEGSAEYREQNPNGPHGTGFPPFEYYPADFTPKGHLYIYFPT